jgi:hypothetical protein
MKRFLVFVVIFTIAFAAAAGLYAERGDEKDNNKDQKQSRQAEQQASPQSEKQVRSEDKPRAVQPVRQDNRKSGVKQAAAPKVDRTRPQVQSKPEQGTKAANVVHSKPIAQDNVKKELRKTGVTKKPGYIANQADILRTDRQHSMIRFPQAGPDREKLIASPVSVRHFNDAVVRNHMRLLDRDDWRLKVRNLNSIEIVINRYYWHSDTGFKYCHYIDNSGYQWYGWYVGARFFWNRYYNGRWWWYDSDFDRWCFWDNGSWLWQDPYHPGVLYRYDNAVYLQFGRGPAYRNSVEQFIHAGLYEP